MRKTRATWSAKVAVLALLLCAVGSARAASHLPFISDDYDRARAEATARHLPLVLEVWSPW